jgi:hypothetical protein
MLTIPVLTHPVLVNLNPICHVLYELKIACDDIFDTHISVTSTLASSEESIRAGEIALTNGEPGVGVSDAPAPVPVFETGPGFFCCLFLLS